MKKWICSLNHQGISPIFHSAYYGNIKALQTFEKLGADLLQKNHIGESLLDSAVSNNQLLAVIYLSKTLSLLDQDHQGQNLLIKATKNSDLRIVEFLLSNRVEVDHQDKLGNTALHYAVQ